MTSNRDAPFDGLQWIIQIRRILELELEDDDAIPISISTVPKPLVYGKPEAYAPQFIALGPYHHFQEELHEMERYKLLVAKRAQNNFPNLKLNHLVDVFLTFDYAIRAHYHRYINMGEETFAWIMAIDSSFLLEFLQIYAIQEERSLQKIPSWLSYLVGSMGRRSTYNLIIRDVVMLENQIPLFLLRKILELRCSSSKNGDELLAMMIIGFLKEICPFKMMDSALCIDVKQHSHLLELLYHSIVPQCGEDYDIETNDHIEHCQTSSSWIKWLISTIGAFLLQRCKSFALIIIKFMMKVPWGIMSNLPVLSIIKQPVERFFMQLDQNSNDKGSNASPDMSTLPLMEEIAIPSVNELTTAGIKLGPTNGDLSTIEFNPKTATFHLPSITLDVNSEVLFRNLVAYETCIASGPLFFTRYIELMNGIIDSEQDVMILRKCGILFNRMRSDKQVANLWNGMSRSVWLTRVPNLDQIIEDVNKCYKSRWRVKTRRFIKRYVLGSWQLLAIIAGVFLLLMIGL